MNVNKPFPPVMRETIGQGFHGVHSVHGKQQVENCKM